MTTDFSDNMPIPTSSTTTSLDYDSHIAVTVLVSVVALFLICSLVVFAQYCFSNHHHEQATATPVHTGASSLAALSPPGLNAAAVAALPVVRYTGGGSSNDGCAVCLVEYVDKEKVKVIPGCGHGFHSKCIETWLMRKGSCPVCRCSDIWGRWSWEICAAGVFGCSEGNVGKLRTSRSCERCCSELEEGGGGGEMLLRRTCSV